MRPPKELALPIHTLARAGSRVIERCEWESCARKEHDEWCPNEVWISEMCACRVRKRIEVSRKIVKLQFYAAFRVGTFHRFVDTSSAVWAIVFHAARFAAHSIRASKPQRFDYLSSAILINSKRIDFWMCRRSADAVNFTILFSFELK